MKKSLCACYYEEDCNSSQVFEIKKQSACICLISEMVKSLEMKLGIMQPYFFPYIGYFQLIKAVDQFVVYDDVQWIKGGWINRNRILAQGMPHYITLPLQKDSTFLNINQRILSADIDKQKSNIFRKVEAAYRTAPQFQEVMEMISECFACADRNLSGFVVNSLRVCCEYLKIKTPLILSSQLGLDTKLRGQDRVLEINAIMGATHYINLIGGTGLYSKEIFSEKGLHLTFLRPRNIVYNQSQKGNFVPFLSIIDVLMFNNPLRCSQMLEEYELE